MGSFFYIIVIIAVIYGAIKKQNQGQQKGTRQTQDPNQMNRGKSGQPWAQNSNQMNRANNGQSWVQNGNQMNRANNGQPWSPNGNQMNHGSGGQSWSRNENSYARQQQNMDEGRRQGMDSAAMIQKQRELKERLQRQYGKSMQGYENSQGVDPYHEEKLLTESRKYNESLDQSGDIMDRVNASAKERSTAEEATKNRRKIDDSLQQGDRADIMMEVMDFKDSSKLMEEVSDLIIMGYQSKLPFDRDFVEEGLQMLGQYES